VLGAAVDQEMLVKETTVLGGVACLTPEGKQRLLRQTARAHSLRVFVETGTHAGDTLAAMLAEPIIIDRAYSAELSESHFERAAERFEGEPRLELYRGDSARYVRELVPRLDAPTLFWLDAHPGEPGTAGRYGESPLRDELRAIFAAPRFDHVVLIDDVRLFRERGWPSLDEVTQIASGWKVAVEMDIARISR
jgi:hypothetical protein